MRFDKICALLTLCAICALPNDGYAKKHHCGAGTYNYSVAGTKGSCEACPAGCWCAGNIGNKDDWSGYKITGCIPGVVKRNGGGNWGDNQDGTGVYSCPAKFPNSPTWARSKEECYTSVGSTKINYPGKNCMRGKYLPKNSMTCADCTTGPMDYCTGGRELIMSTTQDQGIATCPAGKRANADHTACENAPAASDCPAGTYLRADSTSCTQCPSDFICPGGSFYKQSYDQGKEACEGNSVPNANHTACVSGDVNCIAGTYLPANTKTCAACPDGYVCAGGAFSQQPIDMGKERCSGDKVPNEQKTACVSCAAGQKPNDDNTACSDADIVVSPGWYLPANAVQQRQCFGEKKYCPGGEYSKKSTEQGRFDCPYNSNPTKNRAACELKLTKDQLKFGPLGKQGSIECWAMTSPEDYTACVYGVRTNK